jgi:hypothetical protein
MTIQHDVAQSLRAADQIRWQRQAAVLLGKLLELAAKQHLPAINWTVGSAGATLHGQCITHPDSLRREHFSAWRDAITAAALDPDTGSEHTFVSGETQLLAKWDAVPVDLNPRWHDLRPGSRAPSACVVLTVSIWPDDDEAGQ